MRRYAIRMLTLGTALVGLSCGDSPTVVPTPAPPTTTLPAQPSPSPSATPSPAAQACPLAPGPVARLAISPRGDSYRVDGAAGPIFVKVGPDWDEVVCLDKDKTHRLDFNANQRNADGLECCYEGDVAWEIIGDPTEMIESHASRGDNEDGFIWRFNIDPKGRIGSFGVQAWLDGVDSYPWQSQQGYRLEPLQVVSMHASDIANECQCIYRGNGNYDGARCPKAGR